MSDQPTVAYYDPATGAFYISRRTIPDNIWNYGRIIELIKKIKE